MHRHITAEMIEIADITQQRIQALYPQLTLITQNVLVDLIQTCWQAYYNLRPSVKPNKTLYKINSEIILDYCHWLRQQCTYFSEDHTLSSEQWILLAFKNPLPLIEWIRTNHNTTITQYLSQFKIKYFSFVLQQDYTHQIQRQFEATSLELPSRDNFIQQSEYITRADSKAAWSLLRQSLNNNEIILKTNVRSIEGIYIELFMQDVHGKQHYLSGFTHTPPTLSQWYRSNAYPNLTRMNPDYPYCELPVKSINVLELIDTLYQRGLIYKTKLEQDIATLLYELNPSCNTVHKQKSLLFITQLSALGYTVWPYFYGFIKYNNPIALKDAATIQHVKKWLGNHPAIEKELAHSFLLNYFYLDTKPNIQLDKYYLTSQLACAAIAKTIFNLTQHNHFTLHVLPLIGPIEAVSAIAKRAETELAQSSCHFDKIPTHLQTGLMQQGITSPLAQQLVLLHWRLELRMQAIKGGALRQIWPHSAKRKYYELSRLVHPLSGLSKKTNTSLLAAMNTLLHNPNLNNFNPFATNYTKNKLTTLYHQPSVPAPINTHSYNSDKTLNR